MKELFCVLVFFSFCLFGYGQEKQHETKQSRHRIMAVLGHTHVPNGVNNEGNKEWTIKGSWGLDYDYSLSNKWKIGLHSDLVLEDFVVEEHDGTEVERSLPLALVLATSHKWGQHFALVGGIGGEFSKEESLTIVRVGADYGWELPEEWELAISLMMDFKIDSYNSWVFGIGIGKLF